MMPLLHRAPEAPSRLSGAHDQIRTGDLVLTKDALCRLSYVGVLFFLLHCPNFTSTARIRRLAVTTLPIPRLRLERATGFEPATSSLEGWNSTN
jgi:hypothetical protein